MVKKNSKTSNHKIGAPTKRNLVNFEYMKKLYLSGWDDTRVAGFFNITQRTINNWKRKDKEFFHSLKEWKAEADKKVERSLYDRATGYSCPEEVIFQYQGKIITAQTIKQYPGDVTAQIFWLKNRQPEKWKDKKEWEGKQTTEIKIEHVEIGDRVDQLKRAQLCMSEN